MWKYEKPEMEVIEFAENVCTNNIGSSDNVVDFVDPTKSINVE